MSDADLINARAQATNDVCAAVLSAAGDAMKVHGDDPEGSAIVAAGFAMALQSIGKHIDKRVPVIVHEMLKPK